jgi:hypothetical protein
MQDAPTVTLRVVHDGVQPCPDTGEAVRFGLQDTKGNVHPPTASAGGRHRFDFPATVKETPAGPVLAGPFCQGPPAGRFVYLSWKREAGGAAPYTCRIKLPLVGMSEALLEAARRPDHCLAADVTGRKPHSSVKVTWTAVPLDGKSPPP